MERRVLSRRVVANCIHDARTRNKLRFRAGEPLLKRKRRTGSSVARSRAGVSQMNSDEVNWLLETIEDPEKAKRFVQAQYERGRITYRVMGNVARDRGWADWPAAEQPPAPNSMECTTTLQMVLAATRETL